MIGIKRREVYIVGKKTLKKSKQTNKHAFYFIPFPIWETAEVH